MLPLNARCPTDRAVTVNALSEPGYEEPLSGICYLFQRWRHAVMLE